MRRDAIVSRLLQLHFGFHPHWATERGYPGLDDRLPRYDHEQAAAFQDAVAALQRELPGATPPGMTLDDQIEWALLRTWLEASVFHLEELDWLTTNPLYYVEALMTCLGGLELRVDLDPGTRRRALAHRLAGVEAFLATMQAQVRDPMQPYVDMAVEMLEAGVRYLGRHARAADTELRGLARRACHALSRAQEALLADVDPRPFAPMGTRRYRRLLCCEHLLTMEPRALGALGRRVLKRPSAALEAAGEPDEANDDDSGRHPAGLGATEVLDYLRRELDEVRRFVEERGIVTLPRGDLTLVETPEYLRVLVPSTAYYPPPVFGAVEGLPTGHLFIRPLPRAMNAADRAYYSDVVKGRLRRNLVVHEVYPGHHTQLLHARRHASPLRRLKDDDVTVEGWAFYCEKLMVDEGLYDGCPSPRPAAAERFRALRVLADVGIHTGRLTLDAAADLFCEHLGEEARPWVMREVQTYAADPSLALSYLVGRELILDLREECRDLLGSRFDLREFHDRFLAEGSIPMPLIRCKLLGLSPVSSHLDR